jgi:hypothetical protein
MDQAEALLPLLQAVTAKGLSLMLFSGYTKETLLASGCAAKVTNTWKTSCTPLAIKWKYVINEEGTVTLNSMLPQEQLNDLRQILQLL